VILLAAIGQTLVAAAAVVNLVRNVFEIGFTRDLQYLIISPVYFFGDVILAVFLFVLYARQKKG
jgi:hypothetical protein